jgi:hypothetical protein
MVAHLSQLPGSADRRNPNAPQEWIGAAHRDGPAAQRTITCTWDP